MKVFNC